MFQLNLPKKQVATAHVAIVCLLIVLSLVFSFMPIITLDTAERETAEGIAEIVNRFSSEKIDPDDFSKIDVTAPKLIKSILLISDLTKAIGNSNISTEDQEALEEKLNGKEGRDTVLLCAGIIHSIYGTYKENKDSNIISKIFNVMITVIAVFYLLGMTIGMPITFVTLAIKALIPVLKNHKDLHLHTAAVVNKLPEKLSLIMTIMLFQSVIPSMNYGSGTLAIWVIAIVCVFLNFVSTRLTAYEKNEFIYLNIVQGASILSIVGFFVYFFNILKTNVFTTFARGPWTAYIALVLESPRREEAPSGYIVDAVLILVYLIVVLASVSILSKFANRLSCALTTKHGKASGLPGTCVLLLAYILPKIVAKNKNWLIDPFDKDSGAFGSFLDLSTKQEAALDSVLVGIILMIAAEIAIIVLEKIFCSNMTKEAKVAVLSNSCVAPIKVAEEAPIAATPAEEAPAEEAPAEETPAEEAPAEEAASEEVTNEEVTQ